MIAVLAAVRVGHPCLDTVGGAKHGLEGAKFDAILLAKCQTSFPCLFLQHAVIPVDGGGGKCVHTCVHQCYVEVVCPAGAGCEVGFAEIGQRCIQRGDGVCSDGCCLSTGDPLEVLRNSWIGDDGEGLVVCQIQTLGRVGEAGVGRDAALVVDEGEQVGQRGDRSAVAVGVGGAAVHEIDVVVLGNNFSGGGGAGCNKHHVLVLVIVCDQLVADQMDVAGVMDAYRIHSPVVVVGGRGVGGACVIDAVEIDIRLYLGERNEVVGTLAAAGIGAVVVSENHVVGNQDAARFAGAGLLVDHAGYVDAHTSVVASGLVQEGDEVAAYAVARDGGKLDAR